MKLRHQRRRIEAGGVGRVKRKGILARLIIRRTPTRIDTRWRRRIDVHWRSSGLSALPLMHRAALMAVALALVATAGAQNAHATYATKTQRRLAAATRRNFADR